LINEKRRIQKMKSKEEIEQQLELSYLHLVLSRSDWRSKKSYVDALKWVLELENEDPEENF